jgi:phenylacetic acid degradation operon negative regulatory protein
VLRPKSIILDLLTPRGRRPMGAAAIIQACALFGITPNAARVTLARLCAEERLERVGHAEYAISAGAEQVNRFVRSWPRLQSLERPWSGGWIFAHLERPAPAASREALARALRMARFAPVSPTLAVRPDNLRLELADYRDALARFGAPVGFFVARAELDDLALVERWTAELWPVERLRAAHTRMAERLERSLARLPRIAFERALVETFRLGGQGIRHLVLDPILPEVIMPGAERARLADTMIAYDEAGRALWRRFNARFEQDRGAASAPFETIEIDTAAAG